MRNVLTDGLRRCFDAVRGRGRLSPELLASVLADLRESLLDADVALPVVDAFVAVVRTRAEAGASEARPERALLLAIREELLALLGSGGELSLRARPPAVILLAGLQGAGKTTTAGKLGRLLRGMRKRVMLASCDARRPAAVRQLEVLATQAGVEFCQADVAAGAAGMVSVALQAARKRLIDVLVVDTAGRGQLEQDLMQELAGVQRQCQPVETLFVMDGAMGQEGLRVAGGVAAGFAAAVSLTGGVLTRTDGDARGGVVLSVRHAVSVPVKFVGTGERLEDLQAFAAPAFVDRILGRGDLGGLVQAVASSAAAPVRRRPGRGLSFVEIAEQLQQLQAMGGLAAVAGKLPAGMAIPEDGTQRLRQMLAAIHSMTPRERAQPELLNASRRRRIARGSGTSVQTLSQLARMQKGGSKLYKRLRKASPRDMARLAREFPGS